MNKTAIILSLLTLIACSSRGANGVAQDLPQHDTISVTIIGDVMLHQSQIDNCHQRYVSRMGKCSAADSRNYDFSPYFKNIEKWLKESDIAVANMEFTLAGAPFRGYPAFCAPDSYADYVADCGVDVFLTANNHILDRGVAGLKRTLEVYTRMEESRGVRNTGAFADSVAMEKGYPLFMECRGVKFAFVNFTYGTNVQVEDQWPKVCYTDTAEIATAMRKARAEADFVIALPHWGIEYDLKHSREQRRIAEFLAKCGADAIVGGHPHVVQDVDSVNVDGRTVPVIYSLGNIISNMSATNTQIGLIVTLKFTRDGDKMQLLPPEYRLTWSSLPGKLTDSHITIPVKEYIDRQEDWINSADHEKMVDTWKRITQSSGIIEK